MKFFVFLALFANGAYGEYIWPSYIISLGALGLLAFLSWRRKQTLEATLKTMENKKKS